MTVKESLFSEQREYKFIRVKYLKFMNMFLVLNDNNTLFLFD